MFFALEKGASEEKGQGKEVVKVLLHLKREPVKRRERGRRM